MGRFDLFFQLDKVGRDTADHTAGHFSEGEGMRKQGIIASIINLFTIGGGFLYLRQPYRALVFLLLAMLAPALTVIVVLNLSPAISPGFLPFKTAYSLGTAVLLVILFAALLLPVFAGGRDDAQEGRSIRVVGQLSGALMGVVLLLLMSFVLFQVYVSTERADNFNQRTDQRATIEPGTNRRFAVSLMATHSAGSFDDSEQFPTGDGVLAGRVLLDGEPLPEATFRIIQGYFGHSAWVTTDSQGHYEMSLPIDNYRIEAIEVRDTSALTDTPVHLLTGMEAPFNGESYSSDDLVNGSGIFAQALDGGSDGPDLNFVTGMQLRPTALTDSEGEAARVKWTAVPGATGYFLQLRKLQDNGGYNTLQKQRLDAPEWRYASVLEPSTKEDTATYQVFVIAVDAKGRVLNHSNVEPWQLITPPVGYRFKDSVLSPCDRKRMEGQAAP